MFGERWHPTSTASSAPDVYDFSCSAAGRSPTVRAPDLHLPDRRAAQACSRTFHPGSSGEGGLGAVATRLPPPRESQARKRNDGGVSSIKTLLHNSAELPPPPP